MEEERVVDKPEEADGGERAEVSEILWTVHQQSGDQVSTKLRLYDCWVWNIVLTERKEPERIMLRSLSTIDHIDP